MAPSLSSLELPLVSFARSSSSEFTDPSSFVTRPRFGGGGRYLASRTCNIAIASSQQGLNGSVAV